MRDSVRLGLCSRGGRRLGLVAALRLAAADAQGVARASRFQNPPAGQGSVDDELGMPRIGLGMVRVTSREHLALPGRLSPDRN
jgi:hypothetical protein